VTHDAEPAWLAAQLIMAELSDLVRGPHRSESGLNDQHREIDGASAQGLHGVVGRLMDQLRPGA
jgi:hypothetical protein